MKPARVLVFGVLLAFALMFVPNTTYINNESALQAQDSLRSDVRAYLESKDSPLAPETAFLMEHKHWKLLIAISAIESQYCKRQLGWNCWGIGGDSAYRKYGSIREAIVDADALIERWQKKGRWLTVDDMNCHYVQPCNPNWVIVVNKVLKQIDTYERTRYEQSSQ